MNWLCSHNVEKTPWKHIYSYTSITSQELLFIYFRSIPQLHEHTLSSLILWISKNIVIQFKITTRTVIKALEVCQSLQFSPELLMIEIEPSDEPQANIRPYSGGAHDIEFTTKITKVLNDR